jgi:hypothetical protein
MLLSASLCSCEGLPHTPNKYGKTLEGTGVEAPLDNGWVMFCAEHPEDKDCQTWPDQFRTQQ